MLTTNPQDPRLIEGQQNETGQHSIYLVLSEEERSKGFVRPYRDSYIHKGKRLINDEDFNNLERLLTEEEIKEFNGKYVAIVRILSKEDGSFLGGKYINQEELNALNSKSKERRGGCGTVTKMGQALSETYARNPKFYGSTFCCGCNKHIEVNEFFWDGTEEEVGS